MNDDDSVPGEGPQIPDQPGFSYVYVDQPVVDGVATFPDGLVIESSSQIVRRAMLVPSSFPASPNYHPGQYTSPRTEPFVLGHITWPDGNLRIVQEEASA